MMQSALFVLEFTNAKPSRILIPKELQSQINRKFSLILELRSWRHVLMLTCEQESASAVLVDGCPYLMPVSRGISHMCETVNGDKANPVTVSFSNDPVSTVFGMSPSVCDDFKKLHTGIRCVNFAHGVSDTRICTVVAGKGHIVMSPVTTH